jgi:hypothetical protein
MPTSFKLVGIGLLLTLIGFFMVQRDVRLRIWGKTTQAEVMSAWARENESTHQRTSISLDYRFTDDKGNQVLSGATVPPDFTAPGGRVDIVYLPGSSDVNRLATQSSSLAYFVFLAGIALTAAGAWYFNRESVLEAQRQSSADIEKWKQPSTPDELAKRVVRGVSRL